MPDANTLLTTETQVGRDAVAALQTRVAELEAALRRIAVLMNDEDTPIAECCEIAYGICDTALDRVEAKGTDLEN